MPRGISSVRKRPITSPWPSVLTSSPGITVRRRRRASSAASRAPPKTLWSVTAIAPSPIASAWSSSSGTAIEQSCDQCVCMCRSQAIQSRSESGSSGWERRRRRRRESPAYSSSSVAATSAKLCGGGVSAASSRASAIDAPAAAASSRSRAEPSSAGTNSAASPRTAAREAGSRAVFTLTRSLRRRGTAGRAPGPARRSTSSQPGRPVSARSTARTSGRSPGRHSSTASSRFGPGANSSVSTPSATTRYWPGKRSRAAAAASGEVASRASTRARSFSRCARRGG